MTIRPVYIKHGKTRYYIQNDGRERQDIAYFDDLTTAATVLRYLRGANLRNSEYQIALDALRNFDSPEGGENE